VIRPLVLAAIATLAAGAARAQQRPLVTEDPEPITAGEVRVEAGIDWLHDESFPLSGLSGELFRLPHLDLTFGLSGIAEFQLDSGFQLMVVDDEDPGAPLAEDLDFTGDTTTDIVDPVIGTKIRLHHETRLRPAMGFRVATRVPSASNESGLGNDSFDWFLTVLAGKSFGPTRVVGNFGMAVLSIPTEGDRQNDVLTYGLSATHRLESGLEILGEVNGRVDSKGATPAGTENRARAVAGLRTAGREFREGELQWYGAVLVGLEEDDPDVGITLGATYRFRGFDPDRDGG